MPTTPEPPPMITLENASFGYSGTPVIDDVSLVIHTGEFTGLIGPNGAGKSTLFKGMLGLIKPLAGTVRYAPEIRGRVGYVPQRDQLDGIYPLTAFAVARMGVDALQPWYRPVPHDAEEHVTKSLDQVGMLMHRDKLFAELSGGQRQRVLIARALAIEPRLLVLDEPTAGIDLIAEESILDLLDKLHKSQAISILMVSHNLPSLKKHVQRVVLIRDHRVVTGTAEELLQPERLLANLQATL
jgi:ABC-type Mn2+/Zn2+ transport system ATPase subunit